MASVTFPIDLGGDGSTVTDDRDPTTGLRGGGYQTRFVPALAQTVTVLNGGIAAATAAGAAQVALAAGQVTLAAGQVALAAAQVALASDEADRAEAAANVAEGAANYQGDYSAIVTYTRGQSVSYLGQVFYAKKTNLGITPVDGADWLGQAQQRGSGGSAVSAPVTLTNTSDGAINVLTTAAGQAVTLPDATTLTEGLGQYTIKNTGGSDLLVRDDDGTLLCFVRPSETASVSLVDGTTAAGVWSFENAALVGVSAYQSFSGITSGNQLTTVPLNGGRVLHLTAGTTLYGVVYDEVNNTWGSATLIASGITTASFRAALDANDVVFLAYCTASSTEGRTLSISGTTITVNSAATQSTNPIISLQARVGSNERYTSHHNLVKSGGSYVLTGSNNSTEIRTVAFTVTGTTVAVGATVSLMTITSERNSRVESLASGQVVVFTVTSSTVYTAQPYTVSGTTLAAGTAVTITVSATYSGFKTKLTTDGRLLVIYGTSGQTGNSSAAVISVSANVATASTVATGGNAGHGYAQAELVHLGGEKYFLGRMGGGQSNIITNTAGVVSAGTPLSLSSAGSTQYLEVVSSSLVVLSSLDGDSALRQSSINTSGASPTLAAEVLSARQISATPDVAFPLRSLEDCSRHPISLLGTSFATGVTPHAFNSDSDTNQLQINRQAFVNGAASVIAPQVIPIYLAATWGGVTRRLSTGSTNAKTWACVNLNGGLFYIAQVEFAG